MFKEQLDTGVGIDLGVHNRIFLSNKNSRSRTYLRQHGVQEFSLWINFITSKEGYILVYRSCNSVDLTA